MEMKKKRQTFFSMSSVEEPSSVEEEREGSFGFGIMPKEILKNKN